MISPNPDHLGEASTRSELAYSRGVPVTDRRSITDWAHEKVDFGSSKSFKGNYDVTNVPWTRAILDDFGNPAIRETTFVAPPQVSGKTIAAEIALLHRIINRPANMSFNTSTNVKAGTWSTTRWEHLLKCCPEVNEQFSEDHNLKTVRRIVFKDGTFLLIQGAETEGNRQADSVEVQINDELHLWEKPWVDQMHSRTLAYKETKKILNISVGGTKGSELEERFLAGTQGEWSHHCPKCSKLFQYVFNHESPKCNIRFDLTAAILNPDDSLDLDAFEKTIHVDCPHCKHEMRYDEARLRRLNLRGEYVFKRPRAGATVTSYHVNAFAIGAQTWAEILTPWVRLHIRGGVFAKEVLRKFICEPLAEFWVDKPMVVSKEIRLGSYKRADVLAPGAWKDEWIRVLAADNQRGEKGERPHRWFVCRAFARDGRSRLVDAGRVYEWSELQDKARSLGVPEWSKTRPGPWVVVDRRFDTVTVDEVCATYKWHGMMGTDRDVFLHPADSDHPNMEMAFSEDRAIDVGFGTKEQGRRHALYFLFASQKIQDALAILRNSPGYEVPSDIGNWCPEYAEHINSHAQRKEIDKKGKEVLVWYKIGGHADHLYDCECEIVTLGIRAGAIKP